MQGQAPVFDKRQAAWNMLHWWHLKKGMSKESGEVIKAVNAIEEEAARRAYREGFQDGSASIKEI